MKTIHKIHNPIVSVVIPCYNEEQYVKDSLDSVLSQKGIGSYEIIVFDDGSTDNTNAILEEYANKYNNIVHMHSDKHIGISNALNQCIDNSLGTYIVRHDADDIMVEDRISIQLKVMKENPYIDILCGSFELISKNGEHIKDYIWPNLYQFSLEDFKNTNRIAHPTVMMKRSSIKRLPFMYEQYFDGCEDYKLWVTALAHGLTIVSISNICTRYRISHNADNNKNKQIIQNIIESILYPINESKDLTCIITFKNENDEVEKTVQNIRGTTKGVHIILVKDGNDDKYDYSIVSRLYKCEYLVNDQSKGVAQARTMGVEYTHTSTFIIMDAHMRLYEIGWEDKVIQLAKEHPNDILCSKTLVIKKDKDNIYTNENGKNKNNIVGANVLFDDKHTFEAKWSGVFKKESDELIEVPCILGAFYVMNKKHWNRIHGLQGLMQWGQDEPLLSVKTYLFGGKSYIINNIFVGHMYRDAAPYKKDNVQIDYNKIFMNHLLCDNELEMKSFDNRVKENIGKNMFDKAYLLYIKNKDKVNAERQYILDNSVHTIKDFYKYNIELRNNYDKKPSTNFHNN